MLDWYLSAFVPDPERGGALMNPPGFTAKYFRSKKPITTELLQQALAGKTRRAPLGSGDDKRWVQIPISIAVTPMHRDGWARAAMLDVDAGGETIMARCLEVCRLHGLWAFVQLGKGDKHDGGHLYIPTDGPQPAALLQALAGGVQLAAGAMGETYPADVDLRLPLMLHLRAPGGPSRGNLLLQDGRVIDAGNVADALEALQTAWHSNSTEVVTAALASLPQPDRDNSRKLHKSKVNTSSPDSVIRWFNDNHYIKEVLSTISSHIHGHGPFICPAHDDNSPSLSVWEYDGRELCRCMSRNSGCAFAEERCYDAFNVYCYIHKLSASEAVFKLATEYGLGQKQEYQETAQPQATYRPTVEQHQATIATLRTKLQGEIRNAAGQRGQVTVIKAAMGLGKTHSAAELAREKHAEGLSVAIVAPTRNMANEEWAERLGADAFVWKSKIETCTCRSREYLQLLYKYGYPLPKCKPDCPYKQQYTDRHGKIGIYQHNHLWLEHGERLSGYDIIIIDESPIGALLTENKATHAQLTNLGQHLRKNDEHDPALLLLQALWSIAKENDKLSGREIVEGLQNKLNRAMADVVAVAGESPAAKIRPAPTDDNATLMPQFFHKLYKALVHDVAQPTNTLVSFGNDKNNNPAWMWYERHEPLMAVHGKLQEPAIIVLDGSANQAICERLYAPWPVQVKTINAPISPMVEIVQCPITASTRKIVRDAKQLSRLGRKIAIVCDKYGIAIEGGITYQGAVETLKRALGGEWLHYGGQRGRNDLANVRTLAIVASPTTPPDALQRKAMALWNDDPTAIDGTWEKREGSAGDYYAVDSRLEAINSIHGLEELRQSIHRGRLILSEQATKVFVFSPWDLSLIGISADKSITNLPDLNSTAASEAVKRYEERRDTLKLIGGLQGNHTTDTLQHFGEIQHGIRIASETVDTNSKDIPLPMLEMGKMLQVGGTTDNGQGCNPPISLAIVLTEADLSAITEADRDKAEGPLKDLLKRYPAKAELWRQRIDINNPAHRDWWDQTKPDGVNCLAAMQVAARLIGVLQYATAQAA